MSRKLKPFHNQLYVVLGLGRTGRATTEGLIAGGGQVWAWDDAAAARHQAVADGLRVIDVTCADWSHATALVVSPGVPLHHPKPHPLLMRARSYGVPVTGDIDLFHNLSPRSTYIGVTGTNGKSTTTALIGHLLRQGGISCAVGGNIGVPVFKLPRMYHTKYVLELSSYQLEIARDLRCRTAVLLNLGPDHLQHHGSMEAYIQAKCNIFNNQDRRCLAIIGIDDPYSQRIYETFLVSRPRQGGKLVPISGHQAAPGGIYVHDGWLINDLQFDRRPILSVDTLPTLKGVHNHQNVAAATAAALSQGVREADLICGLQNFPGIPHRQEKIAQMGDVVFINDSKATNVNATHQVLRLHHHIYWIAGGQPKDDDIVELATYASRIRKAYFIGEAAASFAQKLSPFLTVSCYDSLEEATTQATRDAFEAGQGTVLLAPACASLDQFRDFEHRGEVFRNQVIDLLQAYKPLKHQQG